MSRPEGSPASWNPYISVRGRQGETCFCIPSKKVWAVAVRVGGLQEAFLMECEGFSVCVADKWMPLLDHRREPCSPLPVQALYKQLDPAGNGQKI